MKEKKKYVPRYYGLRIYLTSTVLYIFLVLPIVGILFLKYGPDIILRDGSAQTNISVENGLISSVYPNMPQSEMSMDSTKFDRVFQDKDSISENSTSNDSLVVDSVVNVGQKNNSGNLIGDTILILLKLLLLSFLMGLAFNLPFKIYFKKKRKNKKISDKLFAYCKKYLIKTPIVNSLILLFSYGILILYMGFMLLFHKGFDEITYRFYLQYFFISVLATILTVVFVYYWQKHRVQLKYIDSVYTEEELKRRIFNLQTSKIKNRMWISSSMTTLLPLIIVVFYLFLSRTNINDLDVEEFSADQIQILFGKYLAYFNNFNTQNYSGYFFVNVFDSALMFTGIFTGIFISLIYILIFIRWTTTSIVGPVKELLYKMQLTGQGELDQYSVVRTNDEIGELTEGYNEMSMKIKNYILSISRMNQANSRFVPRQFIEFLGKDSIMDVNLGDQVQKEMTILFSDIREFTSISEEMTPKENFDFLNNYFGYMEPVIRINKGFIDKYMGDSIMALFSEKPEDAVNAAIGMRKKLDEFNQAIKQLGKPTINSGIGLHTGNMMLGIVGGEGRVDGTVISDSVNLASRLEGLTKLYSSSIIISEDTLIKLNDPSKYNFRFIDIVKVKGKKEAIYIFELLDGEPPNIKELKIQSKNDFGKALQYYKNKEFKKALPIFESIYKVNEHDKVAQIYANRCKVFIKKGVPTYWDGIEIIDEK